jgi:hypothetical protein
MLIELPKEGLVNLMYVFNAILLLEYWPKFLDCTNNNDTENWEKSNGRLILPTNQLTTENFKSTRKADTKKKINKNLKP